MSIMPDTKRAVGRLALLAIIVVIILAAGGSITAILLGSPIGLVLRGLILAAIGGYLIYRFRFSPTSLITGLILYSVGR